MQSDNSEAVSSANRAITALEEEENSRGEIELTDSEDEDEFVRRYGDVNFQYIKRPPTSFWFTKPHALNYFKDGVLYRTKGERSSTKTELFLDLMYVGIIANLAGYATDHASWSELLRYILLFVGIWTVWCDIKDFTNYYYNEDLSQKTYIGWILVLLTVLCNNQSELLTDVTGAAYVIVPYILCRVSLAITLFSYSFYVAEHRAQQRIYSVTVLITSALWIIVIFVGTRAKIGVSIGLLVLEQVCFATCFHPWLKKKLSLTVSTALNIEHEVERFSVFVTIAIGEFLYKISYSGDLGLRFQEHLWRGFFLLIIAYVLFWLYSYGSMAFKATHPLRHSASRAILWIYTHLPLVAAIVLAADAGGYLCTVTENEHEVARRSEVEATEEEEPDITAVKFYFTGGLFIALMALGVLGFLDDPKDDAKRHLFPRFWRVVFRFPIGIIILVLPFSELTITAVMGVTTVLMVVLLVWESVTGNVRAC